MFSRVVSKLAPGSTLREMTVTTRQDVGLRAWHWLGDRRVEYRPQTAWPAGTEVTLELNLDDVRTGDATWASRTMSSRCPTPIRLTSSGELIHGAPWSTGRPMEPTNGLGGGWNLDWAAWAARTELAA